MTYKSLLLKSVLGMMLILLACSVKNTVDLSEFIVNDPNLKLEQIAAEPLLSSPVAMKEDEKGQWWVVEMPGYMRDIDGSDEDLADGRIVILSDNDGDGIMDQRRIFLDSLLNPRAVELVYGGVLYSDGTALKWTTRENDQPGAIEIVDSLYVIGGNIEHQPNGLLYNLDNWIYSAKSSVRYRKSKGKWLKEATTARGQWGLSMDQNGRLVYNHNSAPILGDYAMPNRLIRNPFLQIKLGNGAHYTKNLRVYPRQATSVNRGYQPGVLDDSLKLVNYTSACSPHLYLAEKLPDTYHGNAFVCAPEINSVTTYHIDHSIFHLNAERVSDSVELLTSMDETFRPVNLNTGFDGALYIVDLRKGIIQHSAYMTSYLREKILEKGLQKINGLGRIYKVSDKNNRPELPDLHNLSSRELANLLAHKNLKIRMFAQKSLVGLSDPSVEAILLEKLADQENPLGQVHALWTLEGLGLLHVNHLIVALKDNLSIDVWQQALTLASQMGFDFAEWDDLCERAISLNNPKIDYVLAQSGISLQQWKTLVERHSMDSLFVEALVSGVSGKEASFSAQLNEEQYPNLTQLLKDTERNSRENKIQAPQILTETFDDTRTNGLKVFKGICASCHGFDGKGQNQLAPSLASSANMNEDIRGIASIIINGYQSDSSQFAMPMPAYVNDKQLSNQDIKDVISYLKSSFSTTGGSISVEQIDSIRNVAKQRAI